MSDNCKPRLTQTNERLARLEGTVERIEQHMDTYNSLLAEHIKRTNILEGEVNEAKEHRDTTMKLIVKLTDTARKDQLTTIRTSLGLFAALAILISAMGGWIAYSLGSKSLDATSAPTPVASPSSEP